jgi:PGF-CTERM protein
MKNRTRWMTTFLKRTIEHGTFSIMVLLAVSLVAFASPALAQTTVSIGNATVAVDGETTLPIVISNVDDPDGVGTADIKLSFDSDVVRMTASTAGDFDSITPNVAHNESGAASYVTFMAYQSNATGLTSGAIVTTVTLKAVGMAGQESPLDISITTLADNTSDSNDISADDVDGAFTVGGGTDPTPTVTPTVAPAQPSPSPSATPDTTTTPTSPGEHVTPTPAATENPTVKPTTAPATDGGETLPDAPANNGLPGFEGAIAIAGLLAIGYVMMRRD